MILKLKAKHFKGTEFLSDSLSHCALEKAAIDEFKSNSIDERIDNIIIDGIQYKHKGFREDNFNKLKKKAKELNYSNQVLDTFRLTKI